MSDIANHSVSFKVTDICVPEPHEVLAELHANDILQGRVIDATHAGPDQQLFLIVAVSGVSRHVIVPRAAIIATSEQALS